MRCSFPAGTTTGDAADVGCGYEQLGLAEDRLEKPAVTPCLLLSAGSLGAGGEGCSIPFLLVSALAVKTRQ